MGLRFGVLGTGYWAQEAHAAALAASGHADLVGIWGRDPARTEAAGRRFGVAGHSDLDRLLLQGRTLAEAAGRSGLRGALQEGRDRWHEIEGPDGAVLLDLGQVVYLRVESDEHRVGF